MIKRHVTKACASALYQDELLIESRRKRNESTIWQRRFWEHCIRDEWDFKIHVDYIYYNPVKHKMVNCVKDWPYSTFHRYVHKGIYSEGWAGGDIMESENKYGE